MQMVKSQPQGFLVMRVEHGGVKGVCSHNENPTCILL